MLLDPYTGFVIEVTPFLFRFHRTFIPYSVRIGHYLMR